MGNRLRFAVMRTSPSQISFTIPVTLSNPIPMRVKDLTTDELKALIHTTVLEAISDLLPDPDATLTIRPEFEQSLQQIRQRRLAALSTPSPPPKAP